MRKLVAGLCAVALLSVGAAAFACNSKAECVEAGKKAYAQKQYERAREFFKKALQFDPKCEKAWNLYDKALRMMIIQELNEEEGC